jgi:molybdopterin molybdotransferase
MKLVDVTLEQAVDLLLQKTEETSQTEELPLLAAVGRVCAEDIAAPMDNPPFARSPLDGYALQASCTRGAGERNPAVFKIIGEVCAGDFFAGKAAAGEAVRIMTGAPIPAGCDCVVRQESVSLDTAGRLCVPCELRVHEAYCFKGEDIACGEKILYKNEILHAVQLGVLASMGFKQVKVWRQPRVAICSTGDELVLPGAQLAPGKIYNSNLYTLAGRFRELGCPAPMVGMLPDDAALMMKNIRKIYNEVDLLITTGGVSVGKKDIMHPVVKGLLAQRLFWRVKMKPGAPAMAYTCGKMLGIALSGNPFASLTTFELLVRPVLARMSHHPQLACTRGRAVLVDDFLKESRSRRFVRAVHEDGKIYLPGRNASGMLLSAAGCNALIDIPAGTQALHSGDVVEVVYL